jgi:aspartate racemase
MGEHMHPEVSMHTFSLGEYMVYVRAGRWDEVGKCMVASAQNLEKAGASFAVCPDNTLHEAYAYVKQHSPLPFIHIADAVAQEAVRRGFRKLAISGTKYLMTSRVYPDVLETHGVQWEVPAPDERERIDAIIFSELVNGIFTRKSRLYFNTIFDGLKRQGCDAAILGCTEIPLLIDPADCPLPTLDSTRLLARAALRRALDPEAAGT